MPQDSEARERREAPMLKRIPTRSGWEDIRGFDRIKRQYVRLDGDAWLAAHGIQAEGKKRGKMNQPGPDQALPDETYQKIESWVRKRALDCKEDVTRYIDDELANLNGWVQDWGEQNPVIGLDAVVTQRCQDLRTRTEQNLSDLDKQCAEYQEASRDLKDFRQRHRLSRVAHYPNNRISHWLWIPVAGIIESFANANLLGSVSRGGVFEGWMIAAVLTLVNVFLGICAGRVSRFILYDWGVMKLLAFASGLLCTGAALAWNNVAGHVRDVYVRAEREGKFEAIDEAFADACRTMIENPLPWESLPSAGLAFIGVAVFVLTTYKMFTADDPFPGYGARHRKVEELLGRYQDNLNDALEELESARNEANKAIDEIKSRYEIDRAGWEDTIHRLRMVVDNYPANLRQYNKDLSYLLAAYRDANLAERTAAAPPFFGSEPTIDEDVIQPPQFHIPPPPEWGDIPNVTKAGFARVEETYAQLRARYQMLDHVVADYAEDA